MYFFRWNKAWDQNWMRPLFAHWLMLWHNCARFLACISLIYAYFVCIHAAHCSGSLTVGFLSYFKIEFSLITDLSEQVIDEHVKHRFPPRTQKYIDKSRAFRHCLTVWLLVWHVTGCDARIDPPRGSERVTNLILTVKRWLAIRFWDLYQYGFKGASFNLRFVYIDLSEQFKDFSEQSHNHVLNREQLREPAFDHVIIFLIFVSSSSSGQFAPRTMQRGNTFAGNEHAARAMLHRAPYRELPHAGY